jgi:hypothetical protein
LAQLGVGQHAAGQAAQRRVRAVDGELGGGPGALLIVAGQEPDGVSTGQRTRRR